VTAVLILLVLTPVKRLATSSIAWEYAPSRACEPWFDQPGVRV
jgi:hypothetical protein